MRSITFWIARCRASPSAPPAYWDFSSSRNPQCVIKRGPFAEAERLAAGVHEPVHLDVVSGDVLVGGGERLAHALRHLGGDAHRPAVHHARAGPRLTAPRRAVVEPLGQRVDGKVQERHERHLRSEEILVDVRGEIEIPELEVQRADRTGVEVLGGQEHPAHLVQMPVDLLQHRFEPREVRRERLVAGAGSSRRKTRCRPRRSPSSSNQRCATWVAPAARAVLRKPAPAAATIFATVASIVAGGIEGRGGAASTG